jgi:hypothetical protein
MHAVNHRHESSEHPPPATSAAVAHRNRRFRAWFFAAVAAVAALAGASACLNRPLCDVDCQPRTTNVFVGKVQGVGVDKIDLLFMIDNSSSMADKQKVLQEAVPDLVQRLVNPNCVDANGSTPAGMTTPDDPQANCPGALLREFNPIRDIHVGIISSSLGGHGSTDNCVGNDSGTLQQQEANDHGWLIGARTRFATPAGGLAPDPKGFLDWNPITHSNESLDAFKVTFRTMTTAVGGMGCGFESQLESVYRFLVDPNPYGSIQIHDCPNANVPCAYPTGTDQTLLAQRAAFLRPDSLVAIIMLTDENDCSIRESGQGYYAAQNAKLPRGSSICATNPNDPCCYFCAVGPPKGCAEDAVCKQPLPADYDPPNLRCFHQMQRFGFDFLYPTARYVNALSQHYICTSRDDLSAVDPTGCKDADDDKKPDIFENPLLKGTSVTGRDPGLIFFAGILGVPWQDIVSAVKPDNTPYTDNGLHYQTATQLAMNNVWDVILGNAKPGSAAPPIEPTDQLMHESVAARGGSDGENPPKPLVGTEGGYLANPVNGHEWSPPLPDQDDLQYACIFPLEGMARDCATIDQAHPTDDTAGCDCKPEDVNPGAGGIPTNNPLCQDSSGQYSTVQRFAKGYPGLRELDVLKQFGPNSIVASICARNLMDMSAQDYGYRPAVDAIVTTLKGKLTGSCLPRGLTKDPTTGSVPCSVVEVRPKPLTGTPACSATPGRTDANPDVIEPAISQLRNSGQCDGTNRPACSEFYVCAIQEAGEECHTGANPTSAGWCYVDPATQPGDNPALVANCSPTQRRAIRFVDPDHQTPEHDATALIACFGATITQ